MDWKNKLHRRVFALIGALVLVIAGCKISYGPNGGALDYTQLKTITIGEVINKAPIVNLELYCTITGYDLTPMAVSQDNFAERTVFTVTVQVKYVNHVNEKESFERSFKAYRDFPRSQPFVAVQDDLLREIMDDLLKQIYNATVENW